jgi:hypothetical protein
MELRRRGLWWLGGETCGEEERCGVLVGIAAAWKIQE